MLTIIVFVVVLGVLVFFHELGHYLVARRNGIVVEEFGMGYPPRLVKLFRYDGTDFTINLIPFGGFARMKGEDASDLSPGSFNAASRMARAATLIAGPAMNAILAIILFAATYMVGFPAPVGYPEVTAVAAGSLAAQLGVAPGDILLTLGDQQVQVSAISDMNYDVMVREQPAAAGALFLTLSRNGTLEQIEVPAGTALPALLEGVEHAAVLTTQITGIADDAEAPAKIAGLQAGDLVYRVGDTTITTNTPLNEIIRQHAGEEVPVSVLRGQNWETVNMTPRVDPPAGQGALGIQIGPLNQLATLPLLASLRQGVYDTGQYVLVVLQLPVMLLMGQISPAEAQLSGPVGIAQMLGGAMSATLETGLWFPILRLSAVLSAALAITNMLPLPALDGGRLLFILVETLRGRRMNPEREGMIHMVGFMLLLGLLVLVTVRDISGFSSAQGIDWHTILGQ